MIASHVHDALLQVTQLKGIILEKKNFTGYSGKAKVSGGCIALLGSAVLTSGVFHVNYSSTLAVWSIVGLISLLINYTGLFCCFCYSENHSKSTILMPALDAVPAIAVGGILGVTLIYHLQYNLFFGTVMSLYGLAHVHYRRSLPWIIYIVGYYYIICGAICLWLSCSFLNPWPMGIVFFAGELISGIALIKNNNKIKENSYGYT